MGSVFLLLATNNGLRLGFLLALTGLFGWMFIMGVTWWIYGIGYKGPDPSWQIDEVVFGELDQSANDEVHSLNDRDPEVVAALTAADPDAAALTGSQIPESLSDVAGVNPWLVDQAASDGGRRSWSRVMRSSATSTPTANGSPGCGGVLQRGRDRRRERQQHEVEVVTYQFDPGGWTVIEGADPFRGEAQAAADAAPGRVRASVESPADYVALGTFDRGGKPRSRATASGTVLPTRSATPSD